MVVVPPLVSLPVAFMLWRKRDPAVGNIVGMVIVFMMSMGMILLEYADLAGLSQACLDRGQLCWPTPSGFIRYTIYASIGLIHVFVLFVVSLKVEERDRNNTYAPEWRR